MGEVRELYAIFHSRYEAQFGIGEAREGENNILLRFFRYHLLKGKLANIKDEFVRFGSLDQ